MPIPGGCGLLNPRRHPRSVCASTNRSDCNVNYANSFAITNLCCNSIGVIICSIYSEMFSACAHGRLNLGL